MDDCACYLVAALYPHRTAANTLDFLEQALDEVPFPIQRLQTDNGTEFLAYKVRDHLLELCIKHWPISPRTPHLNGKIERAQKTLLNEFYATTTLENPTLDEDLEAWLADYTYRRVHGSLGKTPMRRWAERSHGALLWKDVIAAFDSKQEMNYVEQLTLKRMCARASKK